MKCFKRSEAKNITACYRDSREFVRIGLIPPFTGKQFKRNANGMTLPFALILTFLFSGLVAVSYMFVSVNLMQMQSMLQNNQALTVAEGISHRVKALINTKSKVRLTSEEEDKLKNPDEEEELEDSEDTLVESDEFNEDTEDFEEYYADEIVKISRYITFRNPPPKKEEEKKGLLNPSVDPNDPEDSSQPPAQAIKPEEPIQPEANVEMIGLINIPRGTVLKKGTKIVVLKEGKVNLQLDDIIIDDIRKIKNKLPIPEIKNITPNYAEPDTRSAFVITGDNLSFRNQRVGFVNKEIVVEDIKSGPQVEFLVSMEAMPGITKFYWDSAQVEFYIIPPYDGSSPHPLINDVRTVDGSQLIDLKAGQRNVAVKVTGTNLYLKKSQPIALGDQAGFIPRVKEQSQNGKSLIVTIDLSSKVTSGVHSLSIATEGGVSNTWLFNVLPADEEEPGASHAIVSSTLTLLDVMAVENLLPLIDDEPQGNQNDNLNDPNDPDDVEPEELSERDKLGPYANADLETVWLLETSAMVGKVTKTVSEVIQRKIPEVRAAVTTNGMVSFEGGSFQFLGQAESKTLLVQPAYLFNTTLEVQGPDDEPEESLDLGIQDTANNSNTSGSNTSGQSGVPAQPGKQSPIELGFKEGSFVTVFRDGEQINERDFGIISMLGKRNIDLRIPGLMGFHSEGEQVVQFIPPLISGEKTDDSEAKKHLAPADYDISIPNAAKAKSILMINLEQFSELSDLYTNEPSIPLDEYGLPVGYMNLSYIESTPTYDSNNVLSGKGFLVIDTRGDNQGRPIGEVEISGDSKSPAEFNGIIYVYGNLKIGGNVNINGALIVENEDSGQIQIDSNALGMITYNLPAIKQSILSIPFIPIPGTFMISSKPIDLGNAIQASKEGGAEKSLNSNGTLTLDEDEETQGGERRPSEIMTEEAILEENNESIQQPSYTEQSGSKSGGDKEKTVEEELIEYF